VRLALNVRAQTLRDVGQSAVECVHDHRAVAGGQAQRRLDLEHVAGVPRRLHDHSQPAHPLADRACQGAGGRLGLAVSDEVDAEIEPAPVDGADREVPLAEHVSLRLAAHIEAYPPAEVTLPWNEPGNPKRHGKPVTAPLMFIKAGTALHHSTFNTMAWSPARNAAGIPIGGLHQLRHLFASVLLAGGVDIKALSEYLGHADPTVTLRVYSHLMPSAQGRALRAIEAAFLAEREQDHGPGTALEGESGS